MAKLTINFNANTTGIHYIGYRTHMDTVDTFTVLQKVITTPGSTFVEIPVDGSLYCRELHYSGYIIAGCQLQDETTLKDTGVVAAADDADANKIPDAALTWSQTLAVQTDPCIETTIVCDNVPINTLTLNDGGSGYGLTGPTVVIPAPTAAGGVQATATASYGDGIATGISNLVGGSGYAEADGTQLGIPLKTTGQGATACTTTVDVTFTGGVVTGVVINTAGTLVNSTELDYTIDNASLTVGTAPTTEATFTVLATGGYIDVIKTVTLTNPGSGYQVIPTISISETPSGTAANITAVMEQCPSLNMLTYMCATSDTIAGVPTRVLDLLSTVTICSDVGTLGTLDAQFAATQVGNCKCKGCELVTFDATGATSGTGTISYHRCWDEANGEVLVTRQISSGQTITDVDCIIPETLNIDEGTLNASLVVTYKPCV